MHVQTNRELNVRCEPSRCADAALVNPKTELRIRLGLNNPRTYSRRVPVRLHTDINRRRLHGQQSRCQSAVLVRRDRQHRPPYAVSHSRVSAHRTVFHVPRPPRHVHGFDDRPEFPAVQRLGVRGRDDHPARF